MRVAILVQLLLIFLLSISNARVSDSIFKNLRNGLSRNIKNVNATAETILKLLELPYFRYVKMDLYKECPFWNENSICTNRACSVQVLDEGEVENEAAFMYHDKNLGDLAFPTRVKPIFLRNCDRTRDFCVLEDEGTSGGVYVDLTKNPERFTGYSGTSANKVWQAIYGENCFANTSLSKEPVCVEKKMFYKIISGLHTSISVHICSQYLDRASGEWKRNATCYQQRIAPFPERIENALFVHSVLIRAVSKLDHFFQNQLNLCTGTANSAEKAKKILKELTEISQHGSMFDESLFFQGTQRPLVEDARMKFLNISTIMNCVACQKCRLWGKTQVTGIGAALKVLFKTEPDMLIGEKTPIYPILTRFEVVALINTLHRFTETLLDLHYFESQASDHVCIPPFVNKNEYILIGAAVILFAIPIFARAKIQFFAKSRSKAKSKEKRETKSKKEN